MNEKKRYTFVFWLAVSVILVLNVLIWIYLDQTEELFASNLQERLLTENRFLSRLIDDEALSMIIPGETNSIEYISMLQTLETIRREDSLQSILILDAEGRILVSSPEIIGMQNESIRTANVFFRQALQGNFATSPVQQIGNERFMASYGPVTDVFGIVTGVQVVEAKATYFETIQNLRSQLILFSLINITAITLIAFFLFRTTDRAMRYQGLVKDQEHLAQLGMMSASVAHELRNPLGIIEGSNELIRKKYGRKDDEIFDYIPAETRRLSRIIDTFLSFARSPRINKKEFNVNDFLSRLKVGFVNKKNIEIIYPEISEDLTINSDEDLLEQAVLNILLNAIEAAEEKSSVSITLQKQRNRIHLLINNNGPLIPENDMERIFEPFFTTRERGTGLGLAISKRTIELLGGIISVESTRDKGTTFEISLPI